MSTYSESIVSFPVSAREPRSSGVRRFFGRVDGWLERQAIRSELASLDPRTLADLGINRGDFSSIVDGSFEHPRNRR